METYGRARPFHRFVRRTAATRPMAKIYGVIQRPLDQLVHRCTGGASTATSWLAGVEVTMLTTTGARTGAPRTVPVLGIPDGEDVILIASNFGRTSNPAWYHNLRAHPRATIAVGGVSREVEATALSGAEREQGYLRGEEIFPGFTFYARRTNRRIPVLRLRPIDRAGAADAQAAAGDGPPPS